MKSILTQLSQKHGTDKLSHGYIYNYEKLFHPIREYKLKILEIGAGDTGASHKMWKDYFVNSEIYCFDAFHLEYCNNQLKSNLDNYGIKTFKGNQLSREDIDKFINLYGSEFDIIIDDGAHMPDAINTSLGMLFKHLKNNGIYIIEDLLCSIDRQNKIDVVNNNIKNLLNISHCKDSTIEENYLNFYNKKKWQSNCLQINEKEYLTSNIKDFYFFTEYVQRNNICVITKK